MVFTRSTKQTDFSFIVPDENEEKSDDEYIDLEDTDTEDTENTDPDVEMEDIDVLDDNIQSIYDGDFFEIDPFGVELEVITKEDVILLNNQLSLIRKNYTNVPTVVQILKKNISLTEKKNLLERLFHLANCDILSPEYNSNLKALTDSFSFEYNVESVDLEKRILESSTSNGMSYKDRVLRSPMSFENKVIAYNRVNVMETYMNNDSSEYTKHKMWLDTLLSVPFGVYNDSDITVETSSDKMKTYMKNVRDTLDKELSFLEKPKDQIINLVTQKIRNLNSNINAIGLHSGVGMGKTSIAKSIADALKRPFKMISLGGESDSNALTGHGFTYVGSGSGSIINSLIDTKSMDPVLLFDEIDKISETPHGNEIIGTLIHLIDSTSNNKYSHDKYLSGIEFDLSRVLFIFTYNDSSKINKVLADRLFKIHIENYSFKEKLEITNKHLIRNVLSKFKLTLDEIKFSNDAIMYLVQSNKSDGMRDIKTRIEIIFSRINTLLLTNECDGIINLKYKKLYSFYKTLPVIIPKEHIDIFLDESITNNLGSDPPMYMYV